MKVAIYTRVSTDSENQLNSLKNQQEYYINYCHEKGYELNDMYADEGLTGTNMKREAFLRMLQDAGLNIYTDDISTRIILSDRKPKFDYIITKDVSRFARNTNVMEVVKLLREKQVYIHFQNANIDTNDDNYQFLLGMFLNFAQQESIDRSSKVRFGLKQRARQGKLHFGSERLFGYGYDVETKEIYIIPEEAAIVEKVYSLYTNEQLGSRQIADYLNSKGYTTQNDKIWNANSIVRMLKQEKYTGNVHLLKYSYGDVTKENRQKKLRNVEEWEYKENLIPAIITSDTFELAQEIMQSRQGEKRGTNTPKNIFSKKIRCARCGKNYIRTSQTQNGIVYYFYACATRRRTKECDNSSITLKRLESELQPFCDGKLNEVLTAHKNAILVAIETKIVMNEFKLRSTNDKKDEIREAIQEKGNEIDQLVVSFLSSSDTVKKAVERSIEKLEMERDYLEKYLLTYDDKMIQSEIVKLKEYRNQVEKFLQKKTFTLEEVLNFMDYMTIDGDKINYKFSYDKILPKSANFKEMLSEAYGMVSDFKKELKRN